MEPLPKTIRKMCTPYKEVTVVVTVWLNPVGCDLSHCPRDVNVLQRQQCSVFLMADKEGERLSNRLCREKRGDAHSECDAVSVPSSSRLLPSIALKSSRPYEHQAGSWRNLGGAFGVSGAANTH